MRDIFQRYYETNFWKDSESVSGAGSNLAATAAIRAELPTLFTQLGITSVLDIPCGDFYWFNQMHLKLNKYVGADIVPGLIHAVAHRYTVPGLARYFEVLDAVKHELPEVDLILCRDLLVHFSYADINAALKNFRASGSTWLLATTFPGAPDFNIETGQWHPIDLTRLRYGLGAPELLLPDNSTLIDTEFANKSLGLWRLREDNTGYGKAA